MRYRSTPEDHGRQWYSGVDLQRIGYRPGDPGNGVVRGFIRVVVGLQRCLHLPADFGPSRPGDCVQWVWGGNLTTVARRDPLQADTHRVLDREDAVALHSDWRRSAEHEQEYWVPISSVFRREDQLLGELI